MAYGGEHPLGKEHFYDDKLTEKIDRFNEIELAKRIEFIKNKLQETINDINTLTAQGEKYFAYDHQIGIISKKTYGNEWVGDAMHRLDIQIQVEPDQPYFESEIYDGDHPSPDSRHQYAGASSKYYNKLEPLVDGYITAIEKNSIIS